MKALLLSGLIILMMLTTTGCRAMGNSPGADESAAAPAETITITGRIVYLAVEGGRFAIRGEDGRTYNPENLPDTFRKAGLPVKATARLRPDVMSIHMIGPVIEILEIAVR